MKIYFLMSLLLGFLVGTACASWVATENVVTYINQNGNVEAQCPLVPYFNKCKAVGQGNTPNEYDV